MSAVEARIQEDDQFEAPVGSVFDALAWEIELCGARCMKLDALIGEVMGGLPPEQRARLTEGLHTVDLLAQQLTSLSAFARRVSGHVDPELKTPVGAALSDMTLGALADRMSQSLGGTDKGLLDGEDAGDLDLF